MVENEKLEKIKKSCSTGEKVTKVFFVIAIVCSVICLILIALIVGKGNEFEDMVKKGIEAGYITTGNSIGSVSTFNISVVYPGTIHSDVQVIRDILQTRPYSVVFVLYCSVGCLMFIVLAVMLKLVESVFKIIREEDNPFTEKAIKRILTVMIVSSIVMFFTPGTVYGILGLIITWVVYTILDYGKSLQIQADETL
jgi:hypothetical protein